MTPGLAAGATLWLDSVRHVKEFKLYAAAHDAGVRVRSQHVSKLYTAARDAKRVFVMHNQTASCALEVQNEQQRICCSVHSQDTCQEGR